jgi:hypothetical protein
VTNQPQKEEPRRWTLRRGQRLPDDGEDPELVELVIIGRRRGAALTQLAKEFGVAYQRVREIIRKHAPPEVAAIDGRHLRSARQRGPWDPTRVRLIVAQRASGCTLREIGDEHGITYERVRQILVKHGRVIKRA